MMNPDGRNNTALQILGLNTLAVRAVLQSKYVVALKLPIAVLAKHHDSKVARMRI